MRLTNKAKQFLREKAREQTLQYPEIAKLSSLVENFKLPMKKIQKNFDNSLTQADINLIKRYNQSSFMERCQNNLIRFRIDKLETQTRKSTTIINFHLKNTLGINLHSKVLVMDSTTREIKPTLFDNILEPEMIESILEHKRNEDKLADMQRILTKPYYELIDSTKSWRTITAAWPEVAHYKEKDIFLKEKKKTNEIFNKIQKERAERLANAT